MYVFESNKVEFILKMFFNLKEFLMCCKLSVFSWSILKVSVIELFTFGVGDVE